MSACVGAAPAGCSISNLRSGDARRSRDLAQGAAIVSVVKLNFAVTWYQIRKACVRQRPNCTDELQTGGVHVES
jgi:hypothetical protein